MKKFGILIFILFFYVIASAEELKPLSLSSCKISSDATGVDKYAVIVLDPMVVMYDSEYPYGISALILDVKGSERDLLHKITELQPLLLHTKEDRKIALFRISSASRLLSKNMVDSTKVGEFEFEITLDSKIGNVHFPEERIDENNLSCKTFQYLTWLFEPGNCNGLRCRNPEKK